VLTKLALVKRAVYNYSNESETVNQITRRQIRNGIQEIKKGNILSAGDYK
jgi:hypothetical protein